MNFFRFIGLVFTACMILTGCTQRAATRIESLHEPCPRYFSADTDTLSYAVAFNVTSEREEFVSSFGQFLKKYPFVNMIKDTVHNFIRVQLLPPSYHENFNQPITRIEQSQIIEDIIEEIVEAVTSDSAPVITDSIIPGYGGTVRIYIPRKNVDPIFSRFFNIYPFSRNDMDKSENTLIISDSSPNRITIKINGKFTNAENRALSALDFIDNWTSILKKYPAEGYSLFRNVVGIPEFIAGNEATVRGFNAPDENTITLRLAAVDTLAPSRLRSRRLIDDKLKLGLYHISRYNHNDLEMKANANTGPDKPFLEKVIFCTGGDPNPILSFSLNKYDAVVLTSTNDLEYARRNLSKTASLQEIPGERYFLACASQESGFRLFLKNQINKAELLHNVVKAEGMPINSVVTDDMEPAEIQQNSAVKQLPSDRVFKLVYCTDDPVSGIIAEKLLAVLSHAKVRINLSALDLPGYERCLISRDFDCAVGWVPQNVTNNKSEQLRLASIWFNDETDAGKRLQDNTEIPLFSVKRYLLKKNDLHFYKNSIQGIFRKAAEAQPVNEN